MCSLDEQFLCRKCLRYFMGGYCLPYVLTLPGREVVRRCKIALASHSRACRLPYTDLVCEDGDLRVYCVNTRSLMRERQYSACVATTMGASGEVPGSLVGWYALRDPEDERLYSPHAFVPVLGDRTCGILVVRKKECWTYEWASENLVSADPVVRWCADRIWVEESYRRRGIARSTVAAAAKRFGVEVTEMGWVTPFSDDGEALARSLAPETVHMCPS